MSTPKILILGQSQHGKDTFAELLCERLPLKFCSSSMYVAETLMLPLFNTLLPGMYKDATECYEDRNNWQSLWYSAIQIYNKEDKARLAKELLKLYDMYVGMRDKVEVLECVNQKLFDYIFWVDAGERKPPQSKTSCTIEYDPSYMIPIDNNNVEYYLTKQAVYWADRISKRWW